MSAWLVRFEQDIPAIVSLAKGDPNADPPKPGNTEQARLVLQYLTIHHRMGTKPHADAVEFLFSAVRRIVDGVDPAQALGIKRYGKTRRSDLVKNQRLEAGVESHK